MDNSDYFTRVANRNLPAAQHSVRTGVFVLLGGVLSVIAGVILVAETFELCFPDSTSCGDNNLTGLGVVLALGGLLAVPVGLILIVVAGMRVPSEPGTADPITNDELFKN